MMNQVFSSAVLVGIFTVVVSGQPTVKTGDCPTLTRYIAPSTDNWTQFPIKPNPAVPDNSIQNNLTPAQSINCIETQPGLKVELWASELSPAGKIAYLQDFTFDERGRLWAVEPVSYPNIIRTASGSITDQKFQGGLDRIVILEDTDGDRVMDKLKVFRTGLNLPQAIEVVNGGIVVAMVPYLVFFPNNNDTAGTPVILFNGLGSNTNYDTHGGINSLMYGLDNWIYGHTGYNSCKVGSVNCEKGRSWRFRHTALGHAANEFEVWTEGPANAHGIGQMEDGQLFQSGATGTPHINHSVMQGTPSKDIRDGSPNNLFYPITGDRYLWEGSTGKNTQGWYTSSTTAVSGLQFYTSRLFPKKYWNRFAFTCEGATKLCNQDSLVPNGSTWRAVRMPGPARSNIFASKDAWVAPIQTKTGPDGALWVLDWNNYLFLHNPASPMGVGGAWENSLRTKTTNRIYRVTPDDGSKELVLNLANATVDQLVAALANPNMLWRLHAQRLLIGKGWSADLGDKLEAILKTDWSVDDVDNNGRVLGALWTLHGLGRFEMAAESARWNPVLSGLLLHPAAGVRRNVLRALPRTPESATAISTSCVVNDGNAHVRLQALIALGGIQNKPAGLKAIADNFKNQDTYSSTAFTASGITSAATAPCTPVLHEKTPVSVPARRAQPIAGLKFATHADGFSLRAHGGLPTGRLTVYDLRGRAVFSSRYDAAGATWSQPRAQGLREPVYGYDFRGEDGSISRGRISLIPSL
jgi:putative membrane-bound dehydrogenase-like protein